MDHLNVTFYLIKEYANWTLVKEENNYYYTRYKILYIAHIVLCFVAISTNILVAVTISTSIKTWRYSMGTLMLTLAVCDTALNVMYFINYLLRYFSLSFVVDSSFYDVFNCITGSFANWSKLLMTAFSLNRYALVCKPFTHYRITSRKSTVIQIITLAAIAFITNIPRFIIQDTHYLWICILIKIIIVYFVPLIVTFILTVLVICELNRNHGILRVSGRTEARQGEKNITRAMIATNMAYVLLVLPTSIYTVGTLFNQMIILQLQLSILVLYYSNFTINIFIYTLYLPKFKSTLLGFFVSKCCKQNRNEFARISTPNSIEMRQVLP